LSFYWWVAMTLTEDRRWILVNPSSAEDGASLERKGMLNSFFMSF